MTEKQQMNQAVKEWTSKVFNNLKNEYEQLNIKHVARSPSPAAAKDSMLTNMGYGQGLVRRIGFKFPKHMVFVHKGVGKGVKAADVGSKGTRRPKEWFNPVIEQAMEDLGDIVADHCGDMVVKNLSIR